MVDHPNTYASWNLNKEDKKYLMMEREALAMIFSLQKFRHYLLENPFLFFTNHQDLKYLVKKPFHHDNIFHRLLLFQEFDFEIIIQPGKKNVGSYHLS
jgi:hypothetical protein